MQYNQISLAIEKGITGALDGFFVFSLRKAMWRVHFQLTQRLKELNVTCSTPEEVREKYELFRDRLIREHLEEILTHAAATGVFDAPILVLSLEEFDPYDNPERSACFYLQLKNMPNIVQGFATEFAEKGMYFVARVEGSGKGTHVVISTCIAEIWEPLFPLPSPLVECVY